MPRNSNRTIKATFILFALLLSALALLAGCNLGPQKDAFLRADDEGVLFVKWTREGIQTRGSIEILEKKPDNEIGTTHFMFDGVLDGENVSMAVKSSWTPQGGDKAIKKEITGLLKGGEWYVTPPKTEKSVRSIALTPAFVKDLENHKRRQLEAKLKAGKGWTDHGFIFTDEAGEPLKIYTVRAVHKQICEAAGLQETFKLKVSRHSCASALLNDGVPLKMVSDRLGHSSVAITADVYGVTDEDRQREVSERLERLFGSGKN